MTHDQMIFLARVIRQATYAIAYSCCNKNGVDVEELDDLNEMIDAEIDREKAERAAEPVVAKYWVLRHDATQSYLHISYDPDDVEACRWRLDPTEGTRYKTSEEATGVARNLYLWKVLSPVEIHDHAPQP